jgi:8-oxo-dGTP pyrophosphatase MutT (NUDIX family)
VKKVLTLVLVHQHPRILLGMKKRGFGAGKWNGFGGKVEKGETIEEAARRETREEARIELGKLEKRGVNEFVFAGSPDILQVHVFCAGDFSGVPKETEEMRPQWFDADALPYENMWADDPLWMPLFLSGKSFSGHYFFLNEKTVLTHYLTDSPRSPV